VLPEDTVGPEKQRHLRKAARRYCATLERDDLYMRFDVVSVLMPPGEEVVITLFRDAFQ
jgi:Holliday junction resolvase-like predicted endonuclease